MRQIPPVTRNLLIINVALWLVIGLGSYGGTALRSFSGWLVDNLGLHYWDASDFNPIQVVTYMFVHDPGNPMHLLFNMFTLWMFGRTMETVWGARRFALFYLVCGVGAAIVQEAVWAFTWQHDFTAALAQLNHVSPSEMKEYIETGLQAGKPDVTSGVSMFKNSLITVGASGAIFGLLLGFAFVFPNMPLYLFFIPVPIKAKYMVIGYGVLEFFLGVGAADSSIAHFAHLGGMLFGLMLLLYWKKKGTLGGNFFR